MLCFLTFVITVATLTWTAVLSRAFVRLDAEYHRIKECRNTLSNDLTAEMIETRRLKRLINEIRNLTDPRT